MSTRRASSVATAQHRRFSTASNQPPDEETVHLRQKLALLRGRVQQQHQQQSASPASVKDSSPQSSTPPSSLSRKRTNRRSSIAALTASARAKQVNRTTNPEDHPIKKSTGDTNDSKRTSPKKLSSTKLPRLSPVSNEIEPNHHRAATTVTTATAAQRVASRPRSTSVRTDIVRVRRTKECCKNPTAAATTSGEEKLVDLNRRLLAALLDEDKTPPPPIDRVNLFPEDDDDDDDLLSKSKTRARRQRRQSMPAVKDVKNNTYVDENSNQKPNPGFWKELVDIKSRLQKLEVKGEVDDNGSNSSSTTTTTTAPSVFDHPASVHTPSSPLSNAASSTSSSPRTSVHQKRLQDAYAIFEQKHQLPLYPRPNPLLKSMSAVIAETIAINQKLWAAIPQDLNTDARSLVAMQKSSDNQLRELTEALYLMGGEQEQPVDPVVLPRQYRRQSQVFAEEAAYIPPPSRPTSHYYSPEQPRSRPVSYYHTNGSTFHQHMVKPLQQSPALSVDHSPLPRSSSIRPLKVAGILDYPSDHHYYHSRATSKYYDHHRYASGSLYDD